MSTKKVTVYNTGGNQGKQIETSALNWADLQAELSKAGVNHSGMTAVIGKSKVNLEHKDAMLPDEDFTLFLFPQKTRSGLTGAQVAALSYADLRAELKKLATENKPKFDAHFTVDGKNFTNLPTAKLKELLSTYGKSSTTKPAAPIPAAATAVSAKTSKAAPAKAETKSSAPARVKREVVPEAAKAEGFAMPDTDEGKADLIINIINSMNSPSAYDKEAAINAIGELIATGKVKGKTGTTGIDLNALRQEAEQIKRGMR